MPTGTKIAAIVLVVLLGAAGLYYAFVPTPPAPQFDPTKGSGSSMTDPLSRPNSLPPAGATSSTGAAGGVDALAAGTGANGQPNAGSTSAVTPNTVPGTTLPGSTNPAAGTLAGGNGATTPAGTNKMPAFTNGGGFKSGPGNVPTGQLGAGNTSNTTGTAGSGTIGVASNTGTTNSGTTNTGSTNVGSTGTAGSTVGTATNTATNTATSNSTAASGNDTTYIVKKGDTFQTIAKSFYGSSSKWQVISKANPTVEPTLMKIGTKLRIPAASASLSAETSVASASSPSSKKSASNSSVASATSSGTHVVAKGESLSSIARKYYGDSKHWKVIANANPKVDQKNLAIGTKLSIPPKATIASGGNVER